MLTFDGFEFGSNDLITFATADILVKRTLGFTEEYTAAVLEDQSIQAKGKSFEEALSFLYKEIKNDCKVNIKKKQAKIEDVNKSIAELEVQKKMLLDSIIDYNEIFDLYDSEDYKSKCII
jgi:hypothetical protein